MDAMAEIVRQYLDVSPRMTEQYAIASVELNKDRRNSLSLESAMINPTPAADYLTQAAALRHARIPVTRLHKLVAIGKVRTKAEPGETVRYLVADLDTWLAEQATAPNANTAGR